ncbi:MAG: hypothetical protein AAB090_04715 [Nitrospirota bacterium]
MTLILRRKRKGHLIDEMNLRTGGRATGERATTGKLTGGRSAGERSPALHAEMN